MHVHALHKHIMCVSECTLLTRIRMVQQKAHSPLNRSALQTNWLNSTILWYVTY